MRKTIVTHVSTHRPGQLQVSNAVTMQTVHVTNVLLALLLAHVFLVSGHISLGLRGYAVYAHLVKFRNTCFAFDASNMVNSFYRSVS